MALRSLELFHVAVPLKTRIKHASHERTTSDNLVVRVTLRDGHAGYGEGVPRPYVTGETIESCFATLAAYDWGRLLGDPNNFKEVVESLRSLHLERPEPDPRDMRTNAARCAIELAILDAYGRRFGQSIAEVVRRAAPGNTFPTPQSVRYSGAIMADSQRNEQISAWKMRLYGFHQVKIKVGVKGQDDPRRLARLRKILGRKIDIRLDANEAWSANELVDRVKPLLPFHPSALEQPLPHDQVEALAELRPRLGVSVMLDESLCSALDAVTSVLHKTADLFNVRISKCGGVLSSLDLIQSASIHGIGIQLGCHPGETGLLSAAGRHVAANVRGIRYLEGSYDRHVLADNLTVEDITFGYGGRARPLKGPGLGVHVDPAALERMTVARREIPV